MASVTDVLELPGRDSERFSAAPFAVLPVGSVEFHGAHAPFATDSTLATGFARALAARRERRTADGYARGVSEIVVVLTEDTLTDADVEAIAHGWRDWAARPDAWFAILHVELLASR